MRALLLCIAITILAAPRAARADTATVTTGMEHGLTLGAGYGHALRAAGRPLVVGGEVTLVWADLDLGDFRVRASATAPILTHGRWGLHGGIAPTVRGTENEIARMVGVGVDLSLLAGYRTRRAFVAVEAGYDWTAATHITHSDAYRMLVYSDARDGWYGDAAGTFRAGLAAGVSVGRIDVGLRLGRFGDRSGKPPMFPFYGTLSVTTRW